jgi:hypothetical protein
VAVRAPRALPIHDGMVKPELYGGILQMTLAPIAARYEVEFTNWDGPVTV